MVIWEHEGNVENTSSRRAFSSFIECSQMTAVFYHSVIHGLGFFICFKIYILRAQNNKTRFFYVLYSDKTWVFDQSERAQGPIYISKANEWWWWWWWTEEESYHKRHTSVACLEGLVTYRIEYLLQVNKECSTKKTFMFVRISSTK